MMSIDGKEEEVLPLLIQDSPAKARPLSLNANEVTFPSYWTSAAIDENSEELDVVAIDVTK